MLASNLPSAAYTLHNRLNGLASIVGVFRCVYARTEWLKQIIKDFFCRGDLRYYDQRDPAIPLVNVDYSWELHFHSRPLWSEPAHRN